ncbi:MAG TPA: YggT family protein [Candidatus Saccharimonadales bacterium]|nr:YggT family protein [Candidatus Saccharimonadales bacterium]
MEQTQEVTTTETHKPNVVTTVKTVIPPSVKTEHPQKVFEKKKAILRSYQVIWYILIFVEILLGFRMTFKAIGANPFSGFVSLINAITDPLAQPFSGIVRPYISGSSVIEWSTIVAAIVYLLIAFGLVNLFQFIKPITPEEVEQTVDNP